MRGCWGRRNSSLARCRVCSLHAQRITAMLTLKKNRPKLLNPSWGAVERVAMGAGNGEAGEEERTL